MTHVEQVNIHPSPSAWSHQHSTPTNKPLLYSQLQFNLDPSKNAVQNQLGKPRPIVIEKLLPYPKPSTIKTTLSTTLQPPVTVLSSDRLALAMQLAKMDVKKLKTMMGDDNANNPQRRKSSKETKHKELETKERKPKQLVLSIQPDPILVNCQHRTCTTITNKKDTGHVDEVLPKVNRETARLQRELLDYSSTLNQVVKKLKQNTDDHIDTNDGDLAKEQMRNKLRAAEQQIRSSRILYMLQHKVQDVIKQKSRLDNTAKPTKKSLYQKTFVSAQRAAVRALQMFVTHAPLLFNVSGKLPDSYKELVLLVQKLTILSTEISAGGGRAAHDTLDVVEKLLISISKVTVGDLSKAKGKSGLKKVPSDMNVPVVRQRRVILPQTMNDQKEKYLDQHIDWLKQKADELSIKSIHKDDSTPERISTLRHAADIIGDINTKPKHVKKKSQPGLLLPTDVKRRKLKPPTRAYYSNVNAARNFSAPTVLSKLREHPIIEKRRDAAPAETSKKNLTARQRDQQIKNKFKHEHWPTKPSQCDEPASPFNLPTSPVSRVSSPSSSHSKQFQFTRREIERQHWLDRTKAGEIKTLERMGRQNTKEYKDLKMEFEASYNLVKEAEEAIRNKLKPLLEKAELLAEEEAKREEDYKTSIQKRLAEVASQKALSEGERLAEYILDDLLMGAAVDFHRIEAENHIDYEAAFLLDRPVLENIEQRLKAFEMEEENIRRYWKSCSYVNVSEDIGADQNDPSAKPILFTAAQKERKLPKLPVSSEEEDCCMNTFHVPSPSLASIIQHKEKFEDYLKSKDQRIETFESHRLFEQVSDELLDELYVDVAEELEQHCNEYVNELYEGEFLQTLS